MRRPSLALVPLAAALATGCQPDPGETPGDDDTFVPDPGDTTPPTLEHDGVPSGAEGVAIPLAATASDASGISRVGVSWRRPGDSSFVTELLEDQGGGAFAGEIPASGVTPWGVEYYLVAADSAGNQATWPQDAPASYQAVAVSPDPPEPAYNVAAYHDPSRGGVVVSWYHVAGDDFLDYTIHRGTSESVDGSDPVVGEVADGSAQEFVDASAPTDAYSWYRVAVHDIWGGETWSDVAKGRGLFLHQDSWGPFDGPAGLATTADGGVHVCESGTGSLHHFDASGAQVDAADAGMTDPVALGRGIDTGWYVLDRALRGVHVFGGTGDLGDFIDEAAMSPALGDPVVLDAPTGIAFNAQFQPHIVDAGNARLLRLTDDFVYYTEVGAGGGSALASPYGVVAHGAGHVFLTDSGRDLVVRYRDSNSLTEEVAFGGSGAGDGLLSDPRGIAVDGGGAVLVADRGNGRVARFTVDGAWLGAFGAGVLQTPLALAVAEDGTVYVSDEGSGTVEVFGP